MGFYLENLDCLANGTIKVDQYTLAWRIIKHKWVLQTGTVLLSRPSINIYSCVCL